MLTVGGVDSVKVTDYCDWEYMSVAVLDMTDVSWGSVFFADKPPYQVNSKIVAAIGGGPNGSATKLLPDGGWSSALVADLFTGTDNQTAPFPVSGHSQSSKLQSNSAKSDAGIIAGGVIGGVVLIALLVLLAIFAKRHREGTLKLWRRGAHSPERFEKPEMDASGRRENQPEEGRGESAMAEADVSVYQTHLEAGGDPRSELLGREVPAELKGCDVNGVETVRQTTSP